ncbi:MAG: flagellar biosynthetic protein FliR, partial [Pseudomonadota bacterium]
MMPFLDLLGPDLSYWVAQFVLTVARLSFVIALLPGIGEQMIPAQVRVYVLLGLSAAISGLGITNYVLPDSLTDLGVVVITELLLSLFLGIGLRVVIWTLNIAGSVIAQGIGLAQPLGVALENESQTAPAMESRL